MVLSETAYFQVEKRTMRKLPYILMNEVTDQYSRLCKNYRRWVGQVVFLAAATTHRRSCGAPLRGMSAELRLRDCVTVFSLLMT